MLTNPCKPVSTTLFCELAQWMIRCILFPVQNNSLAIGSPLLTEFVPIVNIASNRQ